MSSSTKWTPERLRQNRATNDNEWYDFELDERIKRDWRYSYEPRPVIPPINMVYPFFGTQGDDLIEFVLGVINERMSSCGDTKAEIAQEMAFAILSGEYSRDQMANEADSFIRKKFKEVAIGINDRIVSLDAPVGDEGKSFYDLVCSANQAPNVSSYYWITTPTPLEELIRKEDAEEKQRWANVWEKDAPLRDTRVVELRTATLGHRLTAAHERRKAESRKASSVPDAPDNQPAPLVTPKSPKEEK